MEQWSAMLDQELLEILVCPACKGELEYRPEANELVCHACRLRFPIQDDIPIMLLDEALPL
jgi:uncharacterized protein YbaR (Trm112 family)